MANVHVTHLHLCSPRIKKSKKLLILADLHEQLRPDYLSAWTETCPDAVLIAGDFIEHEDRRGRRSATLSLIEALANRYAVYYALGNHELGRRGDRRPIGVQPSRAGQSTPDGGTAEIVRLLCDRGACVLDNEFVFHHELCIGALSPAGGDWLYTDWLKDLAEQAGFRLLLCHHPEYYGPFVREYGLDLTVSGHAHGGQWRFFGRGVYAPGQGLFPRLTDGFYDNGRLLVSRGLADRWIVPRIANPKQSILLHLHPSNQSSGDKI